jgi:lipopolysaccharide/colanic/teichoic acid biosynthesis glycosyltransferase
MSHVILDVARRQRHRRMLVGALLATDVLTLAIALGGAGVLRLLIDNLLPVTTLGWLDRHVTVSLLTIPVLLALFWRQGCYQVEHCLAGTKDYAHIAHGAIYGVLLALGLSYFSGSEPLVSRSWLLLVWGTSTVCVTLGRFAARRVVRRLRRNGLLRTSVVIVGASPFGISLAKQFQASEGEGIDVLGFLDEYVPLGQPLLPGISVIGQPGDVVDGRFNSIVDEYILVPQALPHERLEEITRLMVSRNGPVLRMAVSSHDLLTHGVLVTERSHVPLVTLQRARLTGADAVLKRSLDVAGALLALLAVAPITLAALAVAFFSGQRRLFSQQLIFTPGGGCSCLWLVEPEVTGRLPIRGAPALLAVLAGNLSLVGPRPIPWSALQSERAFQLVTSLPPGLTGPWRLSGPHASVEDQSLQDLAYVRNYSIWEDVRILLSSLRPGALLGRWQAGVVSSARIDLYMAGDGWLRRLMDESPDSESSRFRSIAGKH